MTAKGTANRRSREPGDASADQQGAWGRRPVGDLAPTEQLRKTSLSTSTKHHTPSTFKDLTYLLHFNISLQRDPKCDRTFHSS